MPLDKVLSQRESSLVGAYTNSNFLSYNSFTGQGQQLSTCLSIALFGDHCDPLGRPHCRQSGYERLQLADQDRPGVFLGLSRLHHELSGLSADRT